MFRVGWVLWQAAVMGVLGTAWGTRCCAAEVQGRAIEPLEAAKILDALYSGIAGYRWKYRLEFLKAANPKALDIAGLRAAPDGPEFGAGSVTIDIRTMRYAAEYQSVRRWSGGAAKYLSERGGASFDGKTYRKWYRTRHGTTVPSLDPHLFETDKSDPAKVILGPLTGWVETTESFERFLRVMAGEMGLRYLPPFSSVYGDGELEPFPQRLRKWVKQGVQVRVTQRSDGQWEFVYPDLNMSDFGYRTVLDPKRGGVFTLEECFAAELPGAPVNFRTLVRVASSQGVWYPEEVVWVNTLDGTSYRLVLSDVQVNPDFAGESFQAVFPVGTVVDDAILRKTYTVGSGAQNDANAVRLFMQRHGLGPFGPSDATGRFTLLRVTLSVGSLLVFAGCAIWLWRRRKHKRVVLLVLAAIWGLRGVPAWAEDPAGSGARATPPTGEAAVSCCAFKISVLALELFGRAYQPEVLLQALEPRWGEVTLGRLADVLEAHGLRVEARQGISLRDLANCLPHRTLALFALGTPERQHYFAALRDARKRPMLLDPPRALFDLQDVLSRTSTRAGEPITAARLLVLFVWDESSIVPGRLADQLAIEPDKVSLGKLSAAQPMATGEVVLVNRGQQPIMVSAVRASCGCTHVGWPGGILRAGERLPLTFAVRVAGLAAGELSERIVLDLPDGSHRHVQISGEVEGASPPQERSQHKRVTLEVPAIVSSSTFERELDPAVDFAPEKKGRLQVESDSHWLRPSLVEDTDRLRLLLKVRLPPEELAVLWEEGARLEGLVTVREAGTGDRMALAVTVLRKPLARLDTRFMVLKPLTDGLEGQLAVKATSTSERIRVHRVWSEDPRLGFRTAEQAKGQWIIRCRAPASLTRGRYYLCFCEMGCRDLSQVLTFVACVAE